MNSIMFIQTNININVSKIDKTVSIPIRLLNTFDKDKNCNDK